MSLHISEAVLTPPLTAWPGQAGCGPISLQKHWYTSSSSYCEICEQRPCNYHTPYWNCTLLLAYIEDACLAWFWNMSICPTLNTFCMFSRWFPEFYYKQVSYLSISLSTYLLFIHLSIIYLTIYQLSISIIHLSINHLSIHYLSIYLSNLLPFL